MTIEGETMKYTAKSTARDRALKGARRLRRMLAKARAGLTLIEIMIVIAIMAMIAGGATFAFQQQRKAQKSAALTDARALRTIAQQYYTEHRDACPTVQTLISSGEMDSRGKTTDPWNKPFAIVCNGEELDVVSNGPDGQQGTPDDITTAARPAN